VTPARDLTLMRPVAGAVAFLTLLPLGRLELQSRDVARGALFFPCVGAAIGALMGLIAVRLDGPLTPLIAAVAAVAVEAVITGALHLDALADLADGLGGDSRDRALEIMREPSVGAFGVVALALALVFKTTAVAALLAQDDAVLVLAGAGALGRAAPLMLAWALPYARPGEGRGRLLTDGAARWNLAGGLVLAIALAAGLVGTPGLVLAASAAVATGVVGVTAWRRLGGVTGDVLGAAVEVATIGALLAAVGTL
jgi:adenosylcobinamide-GDP ribazoletransferase